MIDDHFIYHSVDGRRGDHPVITTIHRLRYQVYVNEWGFEKPDDHPGGLEKDEHDRHSVHFYACPKGADEIIGSARIILGSDLPFPIERHFDVGGFPAEGRRGQMAEISRLAVSKEYRRRAIDRKIFGLEQFAPNQIPRFIKNGHDFRRHCEHELVRGLYIALYRDSKLRGLTHWYAVMAKGLYVILKRWGIAFVQIGPEKDYHGIRAPYLVSIESIERSLEKFDPVLYCEARSGLMH